MSAIGKPERHTQNRVVAFLRDELKDLYSADKPKQSALVEVLTEMHSALEQRREKTRALKQVMMQELLTSRTWLA